MSGLLMAGATAPPLAGIDLELAPGEVGQLTGPNGAGKSRLLALAAGLVLPATGEVRWQGRAIERGVVALLFQNPDYQLLGRTVAEDLDLTGEGVHARRALAATGCSGREGDTPDALSAGLRRRVALAAVLASGAPLVLLDNPLADCDEAEGQALWRAVAGFLAETGRTTLVAGRLPAQATVDRSWDVRQWQS